MRRKKKKWQRRCAPRSSSRDLKATIDDVDKWVQPLLEGIDFKALEIVSGGATGADRLGEQWALANDVPVRIFVADWNKHGEEQTDGTVC